MRIFLNSQKGMGLIEAIVSAGLLVVAVGGLITVSKIAGNLKAKQDATSALNNYRTMVIATFRGSDSLARTGATPSAGALSQCLTNRINCVPVTAQPLDVRDAQDNPMTMASNPQFGFTPDLRACYSYPSVGCPFRYNVTLSVFCNPAMAGSCDVAQIKAQGALVVAPDFPYPISTRKYDFDIAIGQAIGSYEQGCMSLGGVYQPGEPPSCIFPGTPECPADQVLVGWDSATSSPTCGSVFWDTPIVPGNNIMKGIPAAGAAPQVIPIVPNPGCVDPTKPGCRAFDCQAFPMDPACFDPASAPSSSGDGGCGDGC